MPNSSTLSAGSLALTNNHPSAIATTNKQIITENVSTRTTYEVDTINNNNSEAK